MSEKLYNDLAYAKMCRDRCAGPGAVVVNGVKDLPDIFWLIGWFDWQMEVILIEEEIRDKEATKQS